MPDETPWLSDQQFSAWMALAAMLGTLPGAIDAQLKRDAGINRFEYVMLAELSEAPGHALPMSRLALFVAGSPSRLSHAVDRMERKGWVTRRAADTPGRRMEAVLTEAGLAKVVATAPGHVREARRLVIDALDEEQIAQLDAIARIIVARAAPPEIASLLEQKAPGRGSPTPTD
ncbi:MarR family winged helix-turn-helix transcriptional regulator [Actinotalea sp.]|uniref:MarR family winged helix-turn-helix transcriptional regulator n=1 Tax=Actinotalea sp. TaxID=1872145 RepID=UPI00356ACC93